MKKLVWRVKLIADFGDEAAETEVEVVQIERDKIAVPETLGLSLAEGKRLTAAIQTEMVRAQAATMGERFRYCAHCGSTLSSKGYRCVAMSRKLDTGTLTPRRLISSGRRHGLPLRHRPEAMPTDGNGGTPGRPGWNEEIADCREDVDEMLQPSPRSKPLHHSLALS